MQGFEKIAGFQQVVEVFAHFSQLLHVNFEAVNGSFGAIVAFFEHFSSVGHHLKYILSGITFLKVAQIFFSKLYNVIYKLLGGKDEAPVTPDSLNDQLRSFEKFQNKKGVRTSALRVWLTRAIFASVIVVGYVCLRRLWKKILEYVDLPELEEPAPPPKRLVKMLHDFPGQNPADLPCRKGDVLEITGIAGEWLEAVAGGRKGLVPKSYVQVMLSENSGAAAPRTSGAAALHHRGDGHGSPLSHLEGPEAKTVS
tara:strand:- start:549 stop:1310 length:762 start_codon:yes stop_codon:yes gene_type:complete